MLLPGEDCTVFTCNKEMEATNKMGRCLSIVERQIASREGTAHWLLLATASMLLTSIAKRIQLTRYH